MRRNSPIWAITAYYNPFRGSRRYANYRAFRRNLAVPLLTVEWSPEAEFQLAKEDADVLVQVSGGGLMWQKECLLNIALDHLPNAVPYVAWLDCDILFDNPEWPEETIALLERHQIIQLFEEIRYLPPSDDGQIDASIARQHDAASTMRGILSAIDGGKPFYVDGRQPGGPRRIAGNPGAGYAGHLAWLRQARFYDAGIVGGADRMLIAPLVDRIEESFSLRPVSPAQMRHFLGWVERMRDLLPVQCTFLASRVYHLHHGEISSRNYRLRHAILTECDFDPAIHVSKTSQGVWQWTAEAAQLKARVYDYLQSRGDA